MRKNIQFLLLTSVLLTVCSTVSAQQMDAAKDSSELQAKVDATIERVRQLSQLSSEQLDSLYRKNLEEAHKPIASAPKAGSLIKCYFNRQSENFRLEMMVQNQQNPHVLEIDEESAYRIQTLIDAAVYSASNLPDRKWMQQKLDILKSGDGVMASLVGLDGTFYKFFNRQYGAKCWSPKGGNNAELVSVVFPCDISL